MSRQRYYAAIGQAIRRERMARGWTQLDLAAEVGRESQAAVSYWESGRHHPDAWTIDRLERLFGKEIRP
jgi:transcriptional regulator with XRE-family HTH domain